MYFGTLTALFSFALCLAPTTASSSVSRRDASTTLSNGSSAEGENHDPLNVPAGARLKTISVGDAGAQITTYWNEPVSNQAAEATSAYIIIHGRLRNGNDYWEIMNDALQSAKNASYPGVDSKAFIVAPQFFSTDYNSGEYDSNQLAFGDVNAWQAGDIASHPQGTTLTSMDALDAIVATFANKTAYPNIANITLVGHGGGGQLITRYAAVGSTPDGVYVRFIVGDASSHAYFTKHRPVTYDVGGMGCEYWNTWRYGFENFTGTAAGWKSAKSYFKQYINRDIVFLVANNDTAEGGDQYCPAMMQGGVARRNRNLAWWTYINTLARTVEPVGMLGVANFSDLPDWSSANNNASSIRPRLVVIENADHDASVVFGSDVGRAALFNSDDIPAGWRPDGYTEQLTVNLASAAAAAVSSSVASVSATATGVNISSSIVSSYSPSQTATVDDSSATMHAVSFVFLQVVTLLVITLVDYL